MSKHITLAETGKLLLEAKSLIFCCHVSPDCDTLGSALGLLRYLKQQGKEVRLLVDDVVASAYTFIPGMEYVEHPDPEKTYEAEMLVVIDASSWDRIGCCNKVIKYKKLLNIDHHVSNTEYAEYLYLDAKAAAVGEIMVDLFNACDWQLDKEMAVDFYAAMTTDSGSFRYSNTTSKTMRNAAQLLDLGVNPNEISECLSLNSVATMELLAKVMPTLTFAYEGRVAYLKLSNELYNKNICTDTFVNMVRYIEGVDVGIFFKAVEPNVTRVSLRTLKADAAAIATQFDGGGHVRAAGCTVNADLDAAVKLVLNAVGKELAK